MAQEKLQRETERDIDPNVRQRAAADPASSVWVGASAGSGKTKVLTDRVLRLLLPREDGAEGTSPHKILCLTFTKAGAGEMRLRFSKILSRWAVEAEEKLREDLKNLLGRAASKSEISAARKLFARVVDAPGGLQIMTIHSFCQSVLGRFPLEADVPPHFTPLEEREAENLLARARDAVLKEAQDMTGSPLAEALSAVAGAANDEQFFNLINNISNERYQLRKLLRDHFGAEGLYGELCRTLSVRPGQSAKDICAEACRNEAFAYEELKQAANRLAAEKGKSRADLGNKILEWLIILPEERVAGFTDYHGAYINDKGEPNGKIFTGAFFRDMPDLAAILRREIDRLNAAQNSMNAAACAGLTRHLLILGEAILGRYEALKNERGALDFNDLIGFTLRLLEKNGMASWVLYKLDQGLDHILVDEAQDTNPEQWKIIEILCEEFMAGQGARGDAERTVFVVGDEKQSIYSFQRAAPKEFRRMHDEFKRKVESAGKKWDDVDLNISFRSTKSVLNAVDATFAPPEMRAGLSLKDIEHTARRHGQAGRVELWPLCENDENEEIDPWSPPVSITETKSGAAQLAAKIAGQIKAWLDNGEILESRGRAVRPEDILILFRSRAPFFNQLARALKIAGIPVSGVDRMILNEQLAAQDLLALASFALCPYDDLTLAEVLKSPPLGWDDAKLYACAEGRAGALWEALQGGPYEPEARYLKGLIAAASVDHPYEFFSRILQSPCPAETSGLRAFKKRLDADALDPLEELLAAALSFERGEVASLQNFLRWQAGQDDAIKREMEEPRGEVRLMTIHGAKGLQAPIVILPDTIKAAGGAAANDKRLLWPDKSDLPVPFWTPRGDMECGVFTAAKARIEERQEEEARRLLYVAMTRAEDRLYVCGYRGARSPAPGSWHEVIKDGLMRIEDHKILEDGGLRIENAQNAKPDKTDAVKKARGAAATAPAWIFENAPAEPAPPRPLIPSRPSGSDVEQAALSPLANENAYRFKRGNLTHKLLQFLPELPPEERAGAARDFAQRYGGDLPEKIRLSAAEETLAVLEHPDFAAIFGPGSRAEVAVTGLLESGRAISGQIDRLLVTDKEVLIIDYKTNRPPPTDPKDIPPAYKVQMGAYAQALRAIYPDKSIRCALLWTDGPRLMPLLDF